MKYRKKPVVIDAIQFTPEDGKPWPFGVVKYHERCDAPNAACSMDGRYYVDTLEGQMVATPGDWIIRGIKGEFYPCKPDIFAATYEAAE
jgi:hypothetical protein